MLKVPIQDGVAQAIRFFSSRSAYRRLHFAGYVKCRANFHVRRLREIYRVENSIGSMSITVDDLRSYSSSDASMFDMQSHHRIIHRRSALITGFSFQLLASSTLIYLGSWA